MCVDVVSEDLVRFRAGPFEGKVIYFQIALNLIIYDRELGHDYSSNKLLNHDGREKLTLLYIPRRAIDPRGAQSVISCILLRLIEIELLSQDSHKKLTHARAYFSR